MNMEVFSHAMGEIDSVYIQEAMVYRRERKGKTRVKWGVLAACVCLAATAAFSWRQSVGPEGDSPVEAVVMTEEGAVIPPLSVSLSSRAQTDMLAFFIYQGRTYTQYEWIEDGGAVVGEWLGRATGLIDEWTPRDGYVELAGSVSGDFYAVNGYDPSFMLCMQYEDGQVSTYICNRGITLQYGCELYEDRLHLSENWVAVEYESRESWYNSRGEVYALGEEDTELLGDFISGLNTGVFMPTSEIPLEGEETSVYDAKEMYHLYFRLKNGMTAELRLFEGGYVAFEGILDVCVQVPREEFDALTARLAR